jgi:excisionase family DNA binding protein
MCLYKHRKKQNTTNKAKKYDTLKRTAQQGGKENMTKTLENLITIKEAAERLNRHPATILNWVKAGKLPGYKIAGSRWYVDPETFDQLAKRA